MGRHGTRFDVNCSILFTELPLLKRPAAAAAAGFDAVEFWWPFGGPVPGDREADAFLGALGDAGVSLAALNFAGGDLAAGHRGWLSQPGRSAAFRDNVQACAGIAGRRLPGAERAVRQQGGRGARVRAGRSGGGEPGARRRRIADAPGRGAPGTGTIAFGPLLAQLAATGYPGRVGLEYKPADPADSRASFGWLTAADGRERSSG